MNLPRPMSPADLREYLRSPMPQGEERAPITAGLIGALTGHLEAICGGERQRRQFLLFVYNTETGKGLYADQWARLRAWLDPQPIAPENGGRTTWAVKAECKTEAEAAIRHYQAAELQAKVDSGQPLLPGF